MITVRRPRSDAPGVHETSPVSSSIDIEPGADASENLTASVHPLGKESAGSIMPTWPLVQVPGGEIENDGRPLAQITSELALELPCVSAAGHVAVAEGESALVAPS